MRRQDYETKDGGESTPSKDQRVLLVLSKSPQRDPLCGAREERRVAGLPPRPGALPQARRHPDLLRHATHDAAMSGRAAPLAEPG